MDALTALPALPTLPIVALALLSSFVTLEEPAPANTPAESEGLVALPRPRQAGNLSVEEALRRRRSVRSYSGEPLTLAEAGQLLWAAQGVTHPEGKRTAPSAGALYPLEVYLVAGDVEGLGAGIYRYRPQSHDLLRLDSGDRRWQLADATRGQSWVGSGAAVLVIAAVYHRTEIKYGERSRRYVPIEAGAAGQNVYLQAEALELATVMVGAFDDTKVREALALPPEHVPLLLIPVGNRR